MPQDETWAVRYTDEGTRETLHRLDHDTAKQVHAALLPEFPDVEIVDLAAELATRFPTRSYVRNTESGRVGRVTAEPANTSPHGGDPRERIAHQIGHSGDELICVRFPGQVSRWYNAAFFTPVKEDTPVVFPDLPDLARLAHEDPAWRYPSSCGGGYGIARLRVYQTDPATAPTSDGGTYIAAAVAVVSETGKRVTVTNAAEEIWQLLWDMYGPQLILIEHWPADQLGDGRDDTWDQVVAVDGRARWRRIWPIAPENPDHEARHAWMQRTRWLT